jgi:beta-phosphoglucomutase-like phosphatase (HAD superfamily)
VTRAVFFDMDGLIVDTEPIHFKAFRAYMMRDFGIRIPESVMPQFIGYTEEDNLRDLKERYSLDTPLDEMVARRGAIYLDLVRTEPLRVFPGFWEFSQEARARGLKQAVVSSANREQVEIVLGRLFEDNPDKGSPETHFDGVITGDDITDNKPAPDIYLLAAERLGVAPADCLAFEDTPPGVQSAASAGMTVVAVPNEYTRELRFPGARAVIASLDQAAQYLHSYTDRTGPCCL